MTPPAPPQPKYTSMANSLRLVAEVAEKKLALLSIGTARRRLQITPPGGPSTGNGAQTRQALLLTTPSQSLVCGWVDFAACQAEVKEYGALRASFVQRFERPFDVTESEFRPWAGQLFAVLAEFKIAATFVENWYPEAVTDPAVTGSAAPAPGAQPSSLPLLIALGLLLAGSLAAFWLLR